MRGLSLRAALRLRRWITESGRGLPIDTIVRDSVSSSCVLCRLPPATGGGGGSISIVVYYKVVPGVRLLVTGADRRGVDVRCPPPFPIDYRLGFLVAFGERLKQMIAQVFLCHCCTSMGRAPFRCGGHHFPIDPT